MISLSFVLFHFGNRMRIKNRKEKNLYYLNKGFKYYEWKSRYITKIANYGPIYKYRHGKDYFKNEEELENWLLATNEKLMFCREVIE